MKNPKMSEQREPLEDSGVRPRIDESDLAVIITGAALSVPGVTSMSARFTDVLIDSVPGMESESPGVRITENARGISVDLYVNVGYGVRIPEAAWEIQNAVSRTVREITGIRLRAVNIHVQGVERQGGAKEEQA